MSDKYKDAIDRIKAQYNPLRIENSMEPLTDEIVQQCLDIIDSTKSEKYKNAKPKPN